MGERFDPVSGTTASKTWIGKRRSIAQLLCGWKKFGLTESKIQKI
jgi:hypothetical protein